MVRRLAARPIFTHSALELFKSWHYLVRKQAHRIHCLLGTEIAEGKGTYKIVAAGDLQMLFHFLPHRFGGPRDIQTVGAARCEVAKVFFPAIVTARRLKITRILVERSE